MSGARLCQNCGCFPDVFVTYLSLASGEKNLLQCHSFVVSVVKDSVHPGRSPRVSVGSSQELGPGGG